MNLFTRNSPYYHLLKYLLFLLKHPVYRIEDFLVQNKPYINGQTSQMKIIYKSSTVFVYPATEDELNQVVSK